MNGDVRAPFTGLLRGVSPPVGDLAPADVNVETGDGPPVCNFS
jgi:hypothetical protein